MHVPHWHRTSERDKFPFIEGLIILLRRLVFPCRWGDVVDLFGRSCSALSRIFRYMLRYITSSCCHLLCFDISRFRAMLPEWAAVVRRRCPDTYQTVVAFLDGTLRKTCRPAPATYKLPPGIKRHDVQRSQYDGRKK